jgi:hypothetical protein
MKRVIFVLGILLVFACSKTEVPVTPTPTTPVVQEESIKFNLTPTSSNSNIVTTNDTINITISLNSKLPTNGVVYSIDVKRLDSAISVYKLDSTSLQSSISLNLKGFYVKSNYSINVTVTSKSTLSNTSSQSIQVTKNLKSSYEMILSSQWLYIPSGYATYSELDYNRDGLPDLLEFQGYNISIPYTWLGPFFYKNNGTNYVPDNISITNSHIFSSKILSGDFNNDGYVDAFLLTGMDAAGCNNCASPLAPLYLLNNQQGKGFKVDSVNILGAWYAGASGDIDGDGDLDVIAFTIDHSNGKTNKILINDGKGNFTPKSSDIDNLPFTDNSELIDMNNDGFPDLVIIDNTNVAPFSKFIRILWNDKHGNFLLANNSSILIGSNMFLNQILAYDLDNDGYKELFLSFSHTNDNGCELVVYKTIDNKTYSEISSQLFTDNKFNTVVPLQGILSISDLDKNGQIDLFNIDKNKNIRWEWNGTVFIKK